MGPTSRFDTLYTPNERFSTTFTTKLLCTMCCCCTNGRNGSGQTTEPKKGPGHHLANVCKHGGCCLASTCCCLVTTGTCIICCKPCRECSRRKREREAVAALNRGPIRQQMGGPHA